MFRAHDPIRGGIGRLPFWPIAALAQARTPQKLGKSDDVGRGSPFNILVFPRH
jgi:hypothetical protein